MNIQLHPEKGVNPRVTVCMRCNEDVGVALLGRHDSVYQCNHCDIMNIGGKPKGDRCDSCKNHGFTFVRKLEDWERLPVDICTKCQEAQEAIDLAVREGGIYWQCKDCESNGALKASSKLASVVRKKMGIEAPNPVGVEFSKEEQCPVCSDDAVGE